MATTSTRNSAQQPTTESAGRTLPPPPGATASYRARAPDDTSKQRLLVTVLEGPNRGKRAVIDNTRATIGTAEDNHLQLEDPYVSRYHCELERRGDTLVLRDTGSRNGTLVNGLKVYEAAIESNAEIRLGESLLVIDFDSGAAAGTEPDRFGDLVAVSPAMREAIALLRTIAPTALTCLVLGETGTGKELAARAIHENSGRRGPFVVIDCGAVNDTLIEDKLFGHQRGAFTGAVSDAPGAMEAAEGGTIFLDEIGDLPLALQPKLLRVLERREVTRLGSHRAIPVDVRVIAATHRNVLTMVGDGKFREDLYYRLSEATVWLPALRARPQDIELIARHLLEHTPPGNVCLEPDALAHLKQLTWPGNVREMRNVLRRACAHAGQRSISASLLKRLLGPAVSSFPPEESETTRPLATGSPTLAPAGAGLCIAEAREAHHREYLQRLREQYGADDAAIAKHMGVHIKYARRLLRRFGIA